MFRWGDALQKYEIICALEGKNHDNQVVAKRSRLKCGIPHGTHRPAEPTVFKEKTGSERGILFDRRGSDEQKHTKIHVYDADRTV